MDGESPVIHGQPSPALLPFTVFPCGVIRGAMQSLGLPCVVSVDVSQLPACTSLLVQLHVHSYVDGLHKTEADCMLGQALLLCV